jgi:nucleoid-associated protein EbfC
MKDIAEMFGKLADFQKQMEVSKQKLGTLSVTAESGGGMLKVSANGHLRITKIEIDPDILSDKEMVEDLLLAAVNRALDQATALAEAEMRHNLPPMPL